MPTLGERLRQGRDAKGLTLQAVSNTTKIREHILASLESDTYTALPAPVFVRGFLRTLSRHLSLNSEELLALYAAVTSPAEAPEPEIEPAKLHPAKAQPLKARPVKLQPAAANGKAPESRISRLLAKNGHVAETTQPAPATNGHHADEVIVPATNGHHADEVIVPAARTNGHSNGATAAEPARTNGHLIEAHAAEIVHTNGHHNDETSGELVPTNGHVTELPSAPKKLTNSRLSKLLPIVRQNGHSDQSKSAQIASSNGHIEASSSVTSDAAKRPVTTAAPVRPALTLVRPNWMTANILMSGLIALLLVAGVAWGGGQVLKGLQQSRPVKALQQAQPTLAAMIQLDPTVMPSPDPTQPAPTPVPAVSNPGPPTVTPAPLLRTLELKLEATARTWIKVESDGADAFQGFLDGGASKGFTAHSRIVLRAGNAGGVNVTVNGKLLGSLGAAGDVVDRQWVISDTGAVSTAPPVWANPIVGATPTPGQ